MLNKQDIGYAKLANLSPEYGLCKTFPLSSSQIAYVIHLDIYVGLIRFWLIFFYHFTDSCFVPPLIYAIMGSSRDIAIGPVAVVSLLLGTLLQNEIDPITHPSEYRRLAFTATFFAGIAQATLGIFRFELTANIFQLFTYLDELMFFLCGSD